jgi:glycosyltransferase involved in cell wall biosynthesis
MKVLLVSSGSGSRGGGEIFLDYLGRGLVERGHEVIMWIPNHPRMDELATKCVRFSRIIRSDYRNTYDYSGRSLSNCFNWSVSYRAAREWEALQPDVIHINKQNLEDGLDLLRAARRCSLPSVCTVHLTQTAKFLGARAAWLRDWIAYWHLSRYGGVLVAVQEQRAAMLREFSTRGRIETVLNGVPNAAPGASRALREKKRRELRLSDRDFLVLGVGRFVEQKRPYLFLQIAKELHARLPETRFLWVGDGELATKWREMVTREQLDGVVSCVGWQDDVLPYLLAGDLMLHVAEFEGLPLAVVEAMAAGLACAVTHNLSSDIPLFNETNVFFADDVAELAQKLRSPVARADIAASGRRLVEDKLSVGTMAGSYERLYLDVIKTAARSYSKGRKS